MNESRAKDIAIHALAWLCQDTDTLSVFMAASGAGPDDLRAALDARDEPDPAFLGAVLDFVMMRDDTVIACSAAQNLPCDQLRIAAETLAGRAATHWT